eukprot:1692057-Pyramimonas_sp.AAC.1
MSLAVGQVCYDSRRGHALTLPTLVGWGAVVRDKFVGQGGLVAPGLRGASVAIGGTKLPPGVVQPRIEVAEEGYQRSLRGQSTDA